MTPPRARLILVTLVFAGWLAYLVFLVATRPITAGGTPLVVSRPQVLTSAADVLAEISDPQKPAIIRAVLWPENAPIKEGEMVLIDLVADCRPLGQGAPLDWCGPGTYLVPLRRADGGKGGWEVAAIPTSPGFAGGAVYRIYPATREALAQYRAVSKPE